MFQCNIAEGAEKSTAKTYKVNKTTAFKVVEKLEAPCIRVGSSAAHDIVIRFGEGLADSDEHPSQYSTKIRSTSSGLILGL